MLGLPIRYSPSGPVIGNNDGGEATPGVGFQLRVVDRAITAGALVFAAGAAVIPETGPADFILEMPNPRPGLRYSAQLLVIVQNNSAAAATFTLNSQWSTDLGGFSPQVAASQNRTFNQLSATIASMHCTYLSTLALGSDMPTPVTSTSTSLRVQFTGQVSVGTAQLSPCTLVGRLIETL